MTAARPLVLVSSDVRESEGYRWHGAPHTYLDALIHGAGATPLIVPSYGADIDLDALLDIADGALITGSRSNVHPARYGATPDAAHEPYDLARDATTLPLIRAALARGLPLLCICRGLQEMNVALGGALEGEIQARPGRMDHRAPDSPAQGERFAIRHAVSLEDGGYLNALLGRATIEVNSLHRQAIGRLAEGLAVEARAPDGTIEAVRLRDATGFALGVQWHPEYWVSSDEPSSRIFRAFGDAMRQRPCARSL